MALKNAMSNKHRTPSLSLAFINVMSYLTFNLNCDHVFSNGVSEPFVIQRQSKVESSPIATSEILLWTAAININKCIIYLQHSLRLDRL